MLVPSTLAESIPTEPKFRFVALTVQAARNAVVIETPQGKCRAAFAYVPRAGEQVVITPVVCSPAAGDASSDLRGTRA